MTLVPSIGAGRFRAPPAADVQRVSTQARPDPRVQPGGLVRAKP